MMKDRITCSLFQSQITPQGGAEFDHQEGKSGNELIDCDSVRLISQLSCLSESLMDSNPSQIYNNIHHPQKHFTAVPYASVHIQQEQRLSMQF